LHKNQIKICKSQGKNEFVNKSKMVRLVRKSNKKGFVKISKREILRENVTGRNSHKSKALVRASSKKGFVRNTKI